MSRPFLLSLYQQPACGIRLNELRFPGGRGQIPAMPPLVVKAEVPDGVDVSSLLERYACTLQLYESTGAVRLPDELLFRVPRTRCQLVPSMEEPHQIEPLFIFGEIVIRECGSFRLRVVLQEIGGSSRGESWTELASIMTDPLDVVEPDQFPGEANIRTPLSQHLIDNGIVLHFPPGDDSINWEEDYPTINGV
ncbi:hypothetical protein PCANC_17382 [Puccinia coronata f. sp. avenae]|uniref:Velvet domain-containing protein n=1 Tax=Puccinia coronata f. sp. avenae TaxID=200324 RepID=A0A2N5SBK4_9BASI|nr:hypothetical protein PCANC_24546 [Puccinia coronata f. sp. avenae]PLW40177.1 hypothetical protein PCASD_12274 [Puccinia coronata f. sp. avenae]PLW43269.1 hypothetical protein PCANC_17382 [Puccinia coronata f. sp. avenae]